MGNWASRPGVEGGWESYWDESLPDAVPYTPAANPAINYTLTGAAPSNYRASSLGDYAVNEYLRGLESFDQLGNPQMGTSPYLSRPLNPGGGGLSDEDKRALYYGMMSANDPALAGIINNITSGQNTGAYLPEGFDYNSNIYLAPRVDDSGIEEWLGVLGTFAGLAGGAGLISGALGAGGALGGLDAFTAADMAAGDAMLGGMGQDYGSFLNSLNSASTTALPTNIADTPVNFSGGTSGGGSASNITPLYDEATGSLLGQDSAVSNSLGGDVANTVGGNMSSTSSVGTGGSNSILDAFDAADAEQGKAMLDSMGTDYQQFLLNPSGGSKSWLDSVFDMRKITDKMFGKPDGSAAPIIGGAIGSLAGLLGGSQQTGTQTTIQDIPDWQKPFVTEAMRGAQTVYQNSTPSTLLQPAEQQMLRTIQGDYLNPETNPYLRATYDQSAKAVTDNYLSATQPRNDALFGRSGQAFGGNSGYQEAVARNQFGLGQNLKNLATDIYGGNYARERQNQFSATQDAPGYATRKVTADFAPVNNYATISGQRTGTQTSTPLYENRAGQALYGGLLGSQIFRP